MSSALSNFDVSLTFRNAITSACMTPVMLADAIEQQNRRTEQPVAVRAREKQSFRLLSEKVSCNLLQVSSWDFQRVCTCRSVSDCAGFCCLLCSHSHGGSTGLSARLGSSCMA